MNAQHTLGRLKVGTPPPNGQQTIGTESGLMVAIATTGVDHPSKANARRLVACWNALDGVSTYQIEAAARSGSITRAFVKVIEQREELLKVVKGFRAWADNQADAQSKGCHATFDLWMLREQCDLASAAIAKAEGEQA